VTSGNTLTRQLLLASVIAMALPGAAGAAPTPKLAVLVASQGRNPAENALLIIDPTAKAIVARVQLSGQPHNIATSPDGQFAYTSNPGKNAKNFSGSSEAPSLDSISVIDLVAQKEVRVVEVGPGANPHGIDFAAGKVYYTAEGSRTVGRYDPKRDVVDWIGGVGQNRVHELVVTRDGSKIFTANIGSDNVAVLASWDPKIDALTAGDNPPEWNVTIIPTGHGIEGLAITPDEREVWVLNGEDATISVIDVTTRKVAETIALNTDHPQRMTVSTDGKLALVPSGTGELLVVDTKSRKVIKRIPNVGTLSHGIAVSPDSAFAYVAALGEAEVAVVDLKRFRVTARIPTGTDKKDERIEGLSLAYRPR
jgi:YVTN family beta-propeller protein